MVFAIPLDATCYYCGKPAYGHWNVHQGADGGLWVRSRDLQYVCEDHHPLRQQQRKNREAIKKALLRYMEWYSEDRYCAGWYIGIDELIERGEDDDCRAMQTLARLVGGWWRWAEDDLDVVFVPDATGAGE